MAHLRVDKATLDLQAPSTSAILATASDPVKDIAEERRRATFDSYELSCLLNGGEEKLRRK